MSNIGISSQERDDKENTSTHIRSRLDDTKFTANNDNTPELSGARSKATSTGYLFGQLVRGAAGGAARAWLDDLLS